MSICQHCGKTEQEHRELQEQSIKGDGSTYSLIHSFVKVCPTATFTPKPDPLKAKPGVRYRYIGISMAAYCDRIGMTDGKLGFTAERGFFASIPMSSDWQEVTEP